MKREHIQTIALLLLISIGSYAQQKEYSGEMHITPLTLQQKGDSVYIKITFDISGVNVDSRRSISLVPALVGADNRLDLPEVVVKGRENYNVYRRTTALMSKRQKTAYAPKAPFAVIPGFKSDHSKTITYTVTVAYAPWMADARLEMYEDLCGCGKPARRLGITMLANRIVPEKVAKPYVITPHPAYVRPVAEAVKRREIIGEVFLNFDVNRVAILPDYMHNREELDKITRLISGIRKDKDTVVRSINVTGYASPEGTLANNRRLSEGRAKALADYLLSAFDYPAELYEVTFGGENWDGLQACVEASQMPYREQVLKIMHTVPAEINLAANTSRKKSLMNLKGGEPYRYMVREFCPLLRKAVCKIVFDVKDFSIEEAKKALKSCPQNLSLNEMFLVAGTYEKGSDDFTGLFETAAGLFPEDITANLNAATAALSRRDTVAAGRYMDRIHNIPDIPEYYNTAGMLEMLTGNYDKAETLLRKAAEKGLPEAGMNLGEIAGMRGNRALPEQE